jgi:hypothetical protein
MKSVKMFWQQLWREQDRGNTYLFVDGGQVTPIGYREGHPAGALRRAVGWLRRLCNL